jgi:hypothetical protein
MAKPKQYKVTDKIGVVGFKGVIHKNGDVISADDVPSANLKAWLRFGQVEEVKAEEPKSEGGSPEQSSDSDQNPPPPPAKEKGSRK